LIFTQNSGEQLHDLLSIENIEQPEHDLKIPLSDPMDNSYPQAYFSTENIQNHRSEL